MTKYEYNFDEDHRDNAGVRISAVVELEVDSAVTHAHGFVHNTNADLVAEYEARFSGLCRAEVIHGVLWAMLFGRRIDGTFFDVPDLEALRAATGLVCDCDEDDDQQEE